MTSPACWRIAAAAVALSLLAPACARDDARIITTPRGAEPDRSNGSNTSSDEQHDAALPMTQAPEVDPDAGGTAGASAATPVVEADAGDACSGNPCTEAALPAYDFGHADISFSLSANDGVPAWRMSLRATGLPQALVDGQPVLDGTELDLAVVAIATRATFTRPDPDFGLFDPLCVDPGQQLSVIPQSNTGADGVPFLGLELAVAPGTLAEDAVTLRLVSVTPPNGGGAHMLWKDGFPPSFGFSSCDGIGAGDAFALPLGHDHFNLGFSGPAGAWRARYEVAGDLATGDSVRAEFDVTYVTL